MTSKPPSIPPPLADDEPDIDALIESGQIVELSDDEVDEVFGRDDSESVPEEDEPKTFVRTRTELGLALEPNSNTRDR